MMDQQDDGTPSNVGLDTSHTQVYKKPKHGKSRFGPPLPLKDPEVSLRAPSIALMQRFDYVSLTYLVP